MKRRQDKLKDQYNHAIVYRVHRRNTSIYMYEAKFCQVGGQVTTGKKTFHCTFSVILWGRGELIWIVVTLYVDSGSFHIASEIA